MKLNNSLLDNLNYCAQRATIKRQAMGAESLHSAVAILGDTPGSPQNSNRNSPIAVESIPVSAAFLKTGKSVSFSPDNNPQRPPTEKRSSLFRTTTQRNRKQIDTQKSTNDHEVYSVKSAVETTDQDRTGLTLTDPLHNSSSIPGVLQATVESLPIVPDQIQSPTLHNPVGIENSTPNINHQLTTSENSPAVFSLRTEGSSEVEQTNLKEIQAKKWKKINILKEFAAEEAAEALARVAAIASKQQEASVQQVDLSDPSSSR